MMLPDEFKAFMACQDIGKALAGGNFHGRVCIGVALSEEIKIVEGMRKSST